MVERLKSFFQEKWAFMVGGFAAIVVVLLAIGFMTPWGGWLGRLHTGWLWWMVLLSLLVGGTMAIVCAVPRYREKRFISRLTAEDSKTPGEEIDEGRAYLRDKMLEAIRTLNSSPDLKKRGELPLYALPWYLLIGAGQAGKTTLLQSVAHLFSPFARPSLGVGGPTSHCDWWFFNTAIILDTSGRYVHPGKVERDIPQWYRLLQLLRHYRPRQPINGLIIVVPADMLAATGQEELRLEAAELRKRLDEAIRELGVDFPVYLLITRCDLIEGFTEFFERLPDHTLKQVFGFIAEVGGQNTDQPQPALSISYVDTMCQSLVERLHQLRLSILNEKLPSLALCQKIFCFPEEFQALQEPLHTFVDALFAENPYQHTPLLRGIFFCSAQQQGTPFSFLRRELHFENGRMPLKADSKSYFLHDLFAVILPRDRHLVRPSRKATRLRRLKQRLGISGCVALCLLLVFLSTRAYLRDQELSVSIEDSFCRAAEEQKSAVHPLEQVDECRHAVQRLIDQNQQRPSWSRVLFRRSVILEERLRQRYAEKFQAEVLTTIDSDLAQRLRADSGTFALAFVLLKRIELNKGCLSQAGCADPIPGDLQLDYQLMLTPLRQPVAPPRQIVMLQNAYESYLRWAPQPKEGLRQEQKALAGRLRGWFDTTQALPQIIHWANQLYRPVTSEEYWGVPPSKAVGNLLQVEGAYTKEGWEQGIRPILQRAYQAVPELDSRLRELQKTYRARYLERWQRFLTEFPTGEYAWAGTRDHRVQLVAKLLDDRSPYNRVVEVAWDHLSPFLPTTPATAPRENAAGSASKGAGETSMAETEADIPAWIRLLPRYIGSESRKASLNALNAIGKPLANGSAAEQSFQLARAGFQEGIPSDKSTHPVLQAWWMIHQFHEKEGSGTEAEEMAFWALVRRPLLVVWKVVLEEAALYLQERWNELLLEVKALPPGQKLEVLHGKGGKVTAFVNGPAAPFLERRGEEYVSKRVADGEIPFADAFLFYLKRSRVGWAQPEFDDAKRRVQVRVSPAEIDADGNLKVSRTELILDCDAGRQSLETLNSGGDFTFIWMVKGCFNTILRVHLSDASGQILGTLERRYQDLAQFLDHFSKFQRDFRLSDFTVENEARLFSYRIRTITLRYRFAPEERQQVLRDLEAYKRHEGNLQVRLDLPTRIVATIP